MIYRIEDGRHEGLLPDGRIITFDGAHEMIECAKLRHEIFKLVGRTIKEMDEISNLFNLPKPVKRLKYKKKKVRITIDPDVEYIGNEKALA